MTDFTLNTPVTNTFSSVVEYTVTYITTSAGSANQSLLSIMGNHSGAAAVTNLFPLRHASVIATFVGTNTYQINFKINPGGRWYPTNQSAGGTVALVAGSMGYQQIVAGTTGATGATGAAGATGATGNGIISTIQSNSVTAGINISNVNFVGAGTVAVTATTNNGAATVTFTGSSSGSGGTTNIVNGQIPGTSSNIGAIYNLVRTIAGSTIYPTNDWQRILVSTSTNFTLDSSFLTGSRITLVVSNTLAGIGNNGLSLSSGTLNIQFPNGTNVPPGKSLLTIVVDTPDAWAMWNMATNVFFDQVTYASAAQPSFSKAIRVDGAYTGTFTLPTNWLSVALNGLTLTNQTWYPISNIVATANTTNFTLDANVPDQVINLSANVRQYILTGSQSGFVGYVSALYTNNSGSDKFIDFTNTWFGTMNTNRVPTGKQAVVNFKVFGNQVFYTGTVFP